MTQSGNFWIHPRIIAMIKRRTRMGEIRNAYQILMGKSEGKVPTEKSTCRLEGNIKMDLKETEWSGVDLSGSV